MNQPKNRSRTAKNVLQPDAISGYMETAPIPQRVAFIKSLAIASSESHPTHPIPICRRLKDNSITTDQVGGVRGDDNTNIGMIKPCTHGGPGSQQLKIKDPWRGDGSELRIGREFGSRAAR
eukprot:SAG31_NODE_132_length_23398_cov_14.557620_2_plen_121_part_00